MQTTSISFSTYPSTLRSDDTVLFVLMPGASGAWIRRVSAMAVVSGVGVAVVYLPQPDQTLVAVEFGVPIEASAGPSVSLLAGYALGILLLAPLADRIAAALRESPPKARARTATVLSGSFVLGLFATRAAVGGLADTFGWRADFVGFAMVVLACIPLTLCSAPGMQSPRERHTWDSFGLCPAW